MKTPKQTPVSHDVIAALLAEHRYVAQLLDVLEQQLSLASRGQPIDREAVRSVMHYMTEYPDAYHHPREDAMFVRLEKREPALGKRIAAIERAHRTLGAAGKELLGAVEHAPKRGADEPALAARIAAYVGAQREHMTIEERDLFPRARRVLDKDDLAAIDGEFRRVTDPIFEASVRDAYAAYPALVRMLVEQPAVVQALDVLDTFFESASTLGDKLFGGAEAKKPPATRAPAHASREAAPSRRRARAPAPSTRDGRRGRRPLKTTRLA